MSSTDSHIRFACKKCGRRDRRPADQAGSLVFCACSYGNRVPWESTVPPDPLDEPEVIPVLEAIPVEVNKPRAVPVLEARPVEIDEDDAPARRPSKALPPTPESTGPTRTPSRRAARLTGKVNYSYCLNHDEVTALATCEACRLPFCSDCVVTLQDQTLCGPCKNFRLAGFGRKARTPRDAKIAFVAAVPAAVVALVLSLVAAGYYLGDGLLAGAVTLLFVAVALPGVALAYALQSLKDVEGRPESAGRGPAMGAAGVSLAGVLWCLAVLVVVVGKRFMGGGG